MLISISLTLFLNNGFGSLINVINFCKILQHFEYMRICRTNTNKYNALQHKGEQFHVHLSQRLGYPPVPLGLGTITDLISLLS